ncbi:MAG: NADH-quinone oxidoreductase subunit B family protein [Nitrospirae bacterium]|nr:NADH-quinone oxidoreductase subunit B family protein [Nitrospirota bacterium]
MIRILRQILRTGIVTGRSPQVDDPNIKVKGIGLEDSVKRYFRRSLTVREVDAGSCNGCELEIHAINNPVYDCERLGIHFTASPRFADILLVTGPVSANMEIALKRTYDSVPSPKIVIACGDCACNGGIFGETYASLGGIDKVIPVNVYIPGCPPTPADILNGFYKIFL